MAAVIAEVGTANHDEVKPMNERDLVMQFESLGGDGHGCEFGIFQRSLGAEPMGLLRWSDLSSENLSTALETDFAGVGEPAFTRIFIPATTGRPEYWTTDSRYHMAMRCFAYPDEIPIERMTRFVEHRQRFLREKLLQDLKDGNKIFVYKNMKRNLTEPELTRLFLAVRRFGHNTLLYMRYEDDWHPPGALEVRQPGLLLGHLDHFSHHAHTDQYIGPADELFLSLCRSAYRVWMHHRKRQTQQQSVAEMPSFKTLTEGLAVAEIAETSGDVDRALELLEQTALEHPDSVVPHIRTASLLISHRRFPEAEAFIEKSLKRFPDEIGLAAEQCWAANHRSDWSSANHRWRDFRVRFPDHPAGFIGGAQALREMQRFDEAEQLLAAAERKFPNEAAPSIDYAWLANHRRNFEDAAVRWQSVRQRFPTQIAGYVGGAYAFRELGRLSEAEDLLRQATDRFPDQASARIEFAWLAVHTHRWKDAVARWQVVRERFPQHIAGWSGAARALRELGLNDEAYTLLLEGERRFPDDLGFALDLASAAHIRRDYAEAVTLYERIRNRFPDAVSAYVGGAQGLRELARFEEADALLLEAIDRFPSNSQPLIERAWLAQVQRDWPTAAERWSHIRNCFGKQSVGFTSGAIALRELNQQTEAEALLADAAIRFPNDRSVLTERAWLAVARRDWPQAVERWANVRMAFPDVVEGYRRGVEALAMLWRYEEAEKLALDAMACFPDNGDCASDYADLALRQNRLDEATARFAAVCERFPQLTSAHLGVARTLRNQFRLYEAEAALLKAAELIPDDPAILYEHAQLPIFPPFKRDQNPEETLRRLERARQRFPGYEPMYIAAITLLKSLKRDYEVEALSAAGMARLPHSSTVAIEWAESARPLHGNDEAIRRLEQIQEKFMDKPAVIVALAVAIVAAGREEDAEALLLDTMQRFPSDSAAYKEYAQMAVHREDWNTAMERWQKAQKRFPDDKAFAQRAFDAQLRLADAALSQPAETATEMSMDSHDHLRTLVMQFESLGGRGIGCEFGMFQRDLGAEPLGLLRWADMPYEGIVWALENRFEGVGAPENTEIFVSRDSVRPEYCSRDLRGFMFMRAFVYEDEMPFDRMQRQIIRRLVFLKNKLIADLEEGSKIFLWRCTERSLTESEIACLHAAVRSYGNNTLLYVRYEDVEHPNGTVIDRKQGLLIGYIDRFKISSDGKLSSAPATASWTAICEKAYSLALI